MIIKIGLIVFETVLHKICLLTEKNIDFFSVSNYNNVIMNIFVTIEIFSQLRNNQLDVDWNCKYTENL